MNPQPQAVPAARLARSYAEPLRLRPRTSRHVPPFHYIEDAKGVAVAGCYCDELAPVFVRAVNSHADLLAALKEIADIPAVAFSTNRLEHATRTIERMCEIARAALNTLQPLTGQWRTRCTVCGKEYEQGCGSSECCGALQEIIQEEPSAAPPHFSQTVPNQIASPSATTVQMETSAEIRLAIK